MKFKWEKIYEFKIHYQVILIKGRLESEGIDAYIIDRKDSAYLTGCFDLYVKQDDVLRAINLIQKWNFEQTD